MGQTRSLFAFFFIFLHHLAFPSLLLVVVVYAGSTRESADRDSLLAFRSKVSNDPLGIFNSWNESTDYCNWPGVTCSKRHRKRVTKLDLQSQQLEGVLSPHIGNLSFLRELILSNNSFRLQIPQELGSLFRLQTLRLSNNSFSGGIPTNLSRCSKLYHLVLRGNDLSGELPSSLGVLSKLQTLNFGNNNFSGKIPPSFGNLTSLTSIRGQENKFDGSIPYTIGRLKNLQLVSLSVNDLSGPIPETVYNLSSLTALWLTENKVSGRLPIDVGFTLPNLKTLSLNSNRITGTIPMSISNMTSLEFLDLAINGLTGKIPYDLGGLRHLRVLSFGINELGNGEVDDLDFLSTLLNCTGLENLVLQDNKFKGFMPEFLSNFSTEMRVLSFGRNQIRGRIPSEIGNMFNLEMLAMEQNLLTGSIPSSIGKLQLLYPLYLGRNKLSGEIPSSIGNLSSLGQIDLGQNHLLGSIPPSIGRCVRLQTIFLGRNNLSGTIPKELFAISSSIQLDLSNNVLTGPLPFEIGKLVQLGYLDISNNNLHGEIPQTLGSCISLEVIQMQGNSFLGKLPSSLESVRGLRYFDLSHNNLSGNVPNYLENFDLVYLDLSWNDFEGELPNRGVFSNFSQFSVTGNKKLCGGIPELLLQSCTSVGNPSTGKADSKSKLKLIVLPLISVLVGIILVSLFIFIYMSRKKKMLIRSSSSSSSSTPRVSYDDLRRATNGFSSSNLIGVGGFGSVYRGILGQERLVVAIKVLNLAMKGATKSFMAECEVLRSTRHRNLVKVITACSSADFKGNDFKALVYEFMINGSLEDWLYPSIIDNTNHEPKYLSFIQRFNIVVDVALALDYLHECQTPIVHCDLKPSNILLDKDMLARVGDFGLAKLCPEATRQLFSTESSNLGIFKGSIGYAAPEYGMGSKVSTYGDVYSFGIILLQVFTGKRPTDSVFKDGLDLHNFAAMALPERVVLIADPIQFKNDDQFIRGDTFWDLFVTIVRLGVNCSVELPRERMNIKQVVDELVHIKDKLRQAGAYQNPVDPEV